MWIDIVSAINDIPGLPTAITIVITIILAAIVYRIACGIVNRTFNNRLSQRADNNNRAVTLNHLINSVIKYVLVFIVIVIILGQFGVNVASILAAAGVVGLAVSFGAQALVKDVFTGFFIILEDQYNVGEYVSINNHLGVVAEVGIRITKLNGLDGEVYIIPNGSIVDVANYCRNNIRVVVDQSIAYDSDIDLAETVMRAVADNFYEANKEDFAEAPTVLGVQALMDSSVTLRLIAYALPMRQWDVERGLKKAIKLGLDEAGIKIPFPVCEIIHEQVTPVREEK
ncbi:MAG: mechanosensitive ion channel family protein [Bacillota bacterium]|nr:mechanosensitive ion channel family protein [Bacillota bacterium]